MKRYPYNKGQYTMNEIPPPLKSNRIFIPEEEITGIDNLVTFCNQTGHLYRLGPDKTNGAYKITYMEYREYQYL